MCVVCGIVDGVDLLFDAGVDAVQMFEDASEGVGISSSLCLRLRTQPKWNCRTVGPSYEIVDSLHVFPGAH